MGEMDWGLKEKQAAAVEQLASLKKLCDECWQEQCDIDAEEAKIAERKRALAGREKLIKDLLEEAGLDTFAASDCVYSIKEEAGIAGPASPEDWEAFKSWMKDRYPDAYEGFFKMHMGSLKAFVKKERDLAIKRGDDPHIPGIPDPEPYQKLKAERKKQKA